MHNPIAKIYFACELITLVRIKPFPQTLVQKPYLQRVRQYNISTGTQSWLPFKFILVTRSLYQICAVNEKQNSNLCFSVVVFLLAELYYDGNNPNQLAAVFLCLCSITNRAAIKMTEEKQFVNMIDQSPPQPAL